MTSYPDTYGEMDEVFIIPRTQINYISNKAKANANAKANAKAKDNANAKAKDNDNDKPSTVKQLIIADTNISSANTIIHIHQNPTLIEQNNKINHTITRNEKLRKIARNQARLYRARNKAELLALLKYSKSLLEMNEKLKCNVHHLKKQRLELIQQYNLKLIN